MPWFRRRKPCASAETIARLRVAEQDLELQKRKFEHEQRHKSELEGALARNHLAQLMLEALSTPRGEAA